jgi:hypothetical protein
MKLRARVLGGDKILDQMLVLRQVGRDPIVVDEPEPPPLSIPLPPGLYRVCARVFNPLFQDCDGSPHEILLVEIEMIFSPAERTR